MEKTPFLQKYGILIVIVFLLFLMFQTCNQRRNVKSLERDITTMTIKQDSSLLYLTEYLSLQIKIEGLESEKRMIQSTDRKIWDLQRQARIDEELIPLKNRRDELRGFLKKK